MKIYLSKKGVIYGPYSLSNIKTFIKEKKVSLDIPSYFKGASEWIPLEQLMESLDHLDQEDPNEKKLELGNKIVAKQELKMEEPQKRYPIAILSLFLKPLKNLKI